MLITDASALFAESLADIEILPYKNRKLLWRKSQRGA